MKIQTQIYIDKILVKPFAILLNFLVRIVGQLLRLDHSLDKDFERIVVCKFKGLGSIIQSTSLLLALRSKYPNAKIVFVSSSSNKALLDKIDVLDECYYINDHSFFKLIFSVFRTWWRILKLRPQVYIDLEIYSNFSTVFTALSLANNRFGYYLRGSEYRLGIYTHMMFFNVQTPISKIYLQFAALFGIDTANIPLIDLGESVSSNLDTQLPVDVNPPYILINPNASDLRVERRWPAQSFVLLIRQITDQYPNLPIYLIGSKGEATYTNQIASSLNLENVRCLAGETSMEQLLIMIQNATLMISNDTGPMHMAFSCKTPVICLFGPCAPDHYSLQSSKIKTIYKKVYCSPCVHEFSHPPCKGDNKCMQLISVAEVFYQVEYFLVNEHFVVENEADISDVIYRADRHILGTVKR